MTRKEEWLRSSGFRATKDDRWLRSRIARLYDKTNPTPGQKKLLSLADRHLTYLDLPMAGNPKYDDELRDLARSEFGKPPKPRSVQWLALRLMIVCSISIVFLRLVLPWAVAMLK